MGLGEVEVRPGGQTIDSCIPPPAKCHTHHTPYTLEFVVSIVNQDKQITHMYHQHCGKRLEQTSLIKSTPNKAFTLVIYSTVGHGCRKGGVG